MTKLLLAILWLFTVAIAYWYGLTDETEREVLGVRRVRSG